MTAVRRSCAAALAVGLLLLLSVPGAPAHASEGACPQGEGVTVVVDFQSLADEILVMCTDTAPDSGFDALAKAGIGFQTVTTEPRFICKIVGLPSEENCADIPPADAYWSYWHAEPGGQWTYATFGAADRTPPPGSVEGWSFSTDASAQDSTPPSIPPPPPADPQPEPEPTDDPTVPAQPTPAPAPTREERPDAADDNLDEETADGDVGGVEQQGEGAAPVTSEEAAEQAAAVGETPPPPPDPTATAQPAPTLPAPADPQASDPQPSAPPGDASASPQATASDATLIVGGAADDGPPIATLIATGLVVTVGGAAVVVARRRGLDGRGGAPPP